MGLDGRLAAEDERAAALLHAEVKAPTAQPFGQWMRAALAEDEAALRIQHFLRLKLRLTTTSTASSSASASPAAAPIAADEDAAHRQYELFLWHGASLGALRLRACPRSGFPRVERAEGNAALPGMWNVREGDLLLSINGASAHERVLPFAHALQILEDGVRPAVLRFRRAAPHELQARDRSRSRRRAPSLEQMEQQSARARLERSLCHLVWREEDGPLGLQLKPEAGKPYPVVAEVHAAGLVARGNDRLRLRAGDALLTVNHFDVQRLGYRRTVQVMQVAPKPLVLTFRRRTPLDAAPRVLEL